VGRHALQHHRGGLLRAHAGGHADAPVGRHAHVGGVGAAGAGPGDGVTDRVVGHTGSEGHHLTGALQTEPARQVDVVGPRALVDVDEVHPGRRHLDEDLAGAGVRVGERCHLEDLGPAVLLESDRLHALSSLTAPRRSGAVRMLVGSRVGSWWPSAADRRVLHRSTPGSGWAGRVVVVGGGGVASPSRAARGCRAR